jgi:uncharacterized membrane protein YhaH (DUF805 family)
MRNGNQFNGGSFLDIKHLMYLYFSLESRINQQRIWLGGLVLGLISIPACIIAAVFFAIESFLGVLAVLTLIATYTVLILIVSIMLPIKRATIKTIPCGTSC